MDRFRSWRAGLVVGLALMVLGTVIASTENACDLKTVEKAFHCKPCKAVLGKKELISGKKYYECEGCSQIAQKSGKCGACGKKYVKKVTEKGVCPKCFKKPVEVEACVKTGYACPKCGDISGKAAKCGACKVAYKKAPVRALIEYRCEGCGKTSSAPGNCESADCEKKSTPLARTCSRSGTEPHAKPAGKDRKKGGKKSGKKE